MNRFPVKLLATLVSLTAFLGWQNSQAATQLAGEQTIEQIATNKYQAVNGLIVQKTLTASQPYFYLYAKGTAKSTSSTGIVMFGLQVACTQGSTVISDYQTTSNHTGSDEYKDGKLQLQVRYLFKAPPGTYDCSVMAKNLIGTNGKGVKLILQKGSETYLATDSNVSGAGSWGAENDASDFKIATSPEDDDAS